MGNVDYCEVYRRARDFLLGSMALLITIVITFIEKFPLTISLVIFMIGCAILVYIRSLLQSVSNPNDKEAIVGVLCMWCLILAHSTAIAIVLPLATLIVILSSHLTGSLQNTWNIDFWALVTTVLLAFVLYVIFWRTLSLERTHSREIGSSSTSANSLKSYFSSPCEYGFWGYS